MGSHEYLQISIRVPKYWVGLLGPKLGWHWLWPLILNNTLWKCKEVNIEFILLHNTDTIDLLESKRQRTLGPENK